MFLFMISIAILATPSEAYASAASPGQIKTAIENKYDDTGPGAKTPDFAYKTYNNIDDALLDYLKDPDTKLPPAEKSAAYRKLIGPQGNKFQTYFAQEVTSQRERQPLQTLQMKPIEEILPERIQLSPAKITKYTIPEKVFYHNGPDRMNVLDFERLHRFPNDEEKPFSVGLKKIRLLKNSPVVLKQSREQRYQQSNYNPIPSYTFTYGVHDRHTGDLKEAKETREGGKVRGYYSVMDPDGKQRTVHYTANDKEGFKATVQRTNAKRDIAQKSYK